jgi:lipoprotein-releasing system permease protein
LKRKFLQIYNKKTLSVDNTLTSIGQEKKLTNRQPKSYISVIIQKKRTFTLKKVILSMNFPYFISKRIRKPAEATFSVTVGRIGLASVALGLVVGIVALAVLLGFKDNIEQKIFLFGSHLQVKRITLNESFEEPPMALKQPIYKQTIANIAHRQAVAHQAGILKTKDELEGVLLKGVGQDYDWAKLKPYLVAGKTITYTDSNDVNQVIISQKIATNLQLSVGASVLLYVVQNPPRVRKLQVVGIYQTHVEEFDNQLVICDLSLVQKLRNWGKDSVGTIEMYVEDFDQLDATTTTVNNQLPPDLRVSRVTDHFPALFDWLQLLDRNTIIFLALILFVACFNIMAVLLVMMLERTPMIGILKAVGSSNVQIQKIFFYLGLRLVTLGLLLGNVVGLGLCWLQQQFKIIPLDPHSYYMNAVPIKFDWLALMWLNIGTIVLVSVILTIPTWFIGRIKPLEAIVFKK